MNLTGDDSAIKGFEEIINNENNRFTQQTIFLIEGLHKVLGKGSLLAYLIHITLRAVEIQRVLKPTGSFYLHCDPTASHYLKLILDSVFCPKGGDFKNEIIWCKSTTMYQSLTRFVQQHDIIFLYTKSDNYTFNWTEVAEPFSEVTIKKYKHKDENGKSFRLHGRNLKGSPIKNATDINIDWLKKAPELCRVDYLDIKAGVKPKDWWSMDIINQAANERLGYPTQKPEKLLEKIIKASSNPGDIILDAYCGCGTTVAVAERLERKWIGIDITYQSISLILKRLEDTIGKSCLDKIELNGVPRDYESAKALALKTEDKVRKEFEKWAVLFYSNNRAQINEKKGGDGGIDGIAFIQEYDDKKDIINKKVIFSVKSDKTLVPAYVNQLKGKMHDKDVAMGILITLNKPTPGMIKEAREMGIYKSNMFDMEFPRMQIVTIKEMFDDCKRLTIPRLEVVKSAEFKGKEEKGQHKLDL